MHISATKVLVKRKTKHCGMFSGTARHGTVLFSTESCFKPPEWFLEPCSTVPSCHLEKRKAEAIYMDLVHIANKSTSYTPKTDLAFTLSAC